MLRRPRAGWSREGVEAIAVCFLFAYANPAHEQAAAKIIRDIAPDLYVSLSHEVNPEWREYERTASTVANAYIGPPVSRYLRELEALSLRRFPRSRALMMKSDGGAASARMLAATPIETVMSGPVAGVIGSRHLGDIKGIENLITFDTGGTSSDMAVLPGQPLFKSEVSVARHPLRTHTVDIETIGAGGGSIASVDLGVLKVGPQSAGANPGPACYGRGGIEPTLTDALVVLGHLSPTALLEGAMPISSAKADEAVTTRVAEPLGLTPIEAAWGILTVLATNVTMAMRTITIERGYDPREFTLVPFGGMGPTIAGRIIAELGISRILMPRDPGTFSAFGMLVTDVHQTRSFTRITRLDAATPAGAGEDFRRAWKRPRWRELMRGKICARAAGDVAQRRHALPRPVLRGQRAGCGACTARPTSRRWPSASTRRIAAATATWRNPKRSRSSIFRSPRSARFQSRSSARSQHRKSRNRHCRTSGALPISIPLRRSSAGFPPLRAGGRRDHRRTRYHRGKDLDHRALSGPARHDRRLPERRDRDHQELARRRAARARPDVHRQQR